MGLIADGQPIQDVRSIGWRFWGSTPIIDLIPGIGDAMVATPSSRIYVTGRRVIRIVFRRSYP